MCQGDMQEYWRDHGKRKDINNKSTGTVTETDQATVGILYSDDMSKKIHVRDTVKLEQKYHPFGNFCFSRSFIY